MSKQFQTIKEVASKDTCLVTFSNVRRTRLITDASPKGLGAALLQLVGDEWRPVSFASKGLTSLEQKYSQPEREGLAVVWACQRFQFFLLGRKFELATDCTGIKFIFNKSSDTHGRVGRWALKLQPFDFNMVYIEGQKNIADVFSRLVTFSDFSEVESDFGLALKATLTGRFSYPIVDILTQH